MRVTFPFPKTSPEKVRENSSPFQLQNFNFKFLLNFCISFVHPLFSSPKKFLSIRYRQNIFLLRWNYEPNLMSIVYITFMQFCRSFLTVYIGRPTHPFLFSGKFLWRGRGNDTIPLQNFVPNLCQLYTLSFHRHLSFSRKIFQERVTENCTFYHFSILS